MKKNISFFFFHEISVTNVIGICVSDIFIYIYTCLYNIVIQPFIIIPNSSKTEQISTEKENIAVVIGTSYIGPVTCTYTYNASTHHEPMFCLYIDHVKKFQYIGIIIN